MKKIFLIDGMYIVYRSFYAITHLTDSKGRPTNALYGFIKSLKKFIEKDTPDYVCIAFDMQAPTFRHLEFKGYKAQRKPMPEDMATQIPWIKEAVEAMGISMLSKEGFEADDVIATLAKQISESDQDTEVVIVSKDKDLLQLVNDKISMYDFKADNYKIGIKEVYDKYGIGPDSIVDMLSLSGDTADNIPGVEGVGPKTAAKLMAQYGSVDSLYKDIDAMKKSKLKDRLIKHKEEVYLNRSIIKVKDDVPVEYKLADMAVKPFGVDIATFLHKFELKSLIKDFNIQLQVKQPKVKFTEINAGSIDALKGKKELFFSLIGNTFAIGDGENIFYADNADAFAQIEDILLDDSIKKHGYDLKTSIVELNEFNLKMYGMGFDIFIAAYLINPSQKDHSLKELVFNLLDIDFDFNEEDGIPLSVYNVYFCGLLKSKLQKEMKSKELLKLYNEVENPMISILADMQIAGIKVDKNILLSLSDELGKEIEALKIDIYKDAQSEFNINSTKELGKVLFEDLKLPVQKKTKTGYSTDTEVLTKLSNFHDLPQKILSYRRNTKLKNTYLDALPECVNEVSGKIHACFNQAVTATGRLSSSNPNLQNIPIRSDIGKQIRKAFVPVSATNVFLGADYSQIELRILAHLSEDKNLIKAFSNNEDVHAFTASLIFGVDLEDVDYDMRSKAKTINFGILYGMSTYGLAQDLNIPFHEAKHFIDTYFKRYPDVAAYMDSIVAEAKEKHFVKTMLNRRRYLPEINSSNLSTRQFAERTAINTVIQGTAADLIKVAMVKIANIIKEKEYNAGLILQIHDELVFEVPKMEVMLFEEEVRRFMESAFSLKVPLKVNIKIGSDWGEI